MSCNIYVDNNEISKAIIVASKGNNVLATRYVTEFHSPEFTKKLKDRMELDVNKIPREDLEEVIKLLQEYHNDLYPDINYSTQLNTSDSPVTRFGYDSVATREEGKKHAANFMFSAYHQLLHDQDKTISQVLKEINDIIGVDMSPRDYFANTCIAKVKDIILDRLVSKNLATKEEVLKLMNKNNTAKIEELFSKDDSLENRNLMALYKEILGNRKGFFEEVFRNNSLGELRLKKTPISEDVTYEAIDEQLDDDSETEENNESSSDDKNNSIKELNEKLGDYNNFMTHVGMSIRGYFSSLPKLLNGEKADGKYVQDTNNAFGIADTMSAAQCIAVLYSYGNFTNRATMIESVREIANNIPGMAAFNQFADYLKQNLNFAFEVYRTFGKAIVSKIETTDANGEFSSRTSNRTADKLTTLKFEFFNSAKATSIRSEAEHSSDMIAGINKKLIDLRDFKKELDKGNGIAQEDIDSFNSDVKTVATEIYNVLKRYYPTISDKAIINYINSDNQIDALSNLINIAKLTIKGAENSKRTYDSRQADMNALYSKKFRLNEALENGEPVRKEAFDEIEENLSRLYAIDYVSKETQQAAYQLADTLVKFSLIKTELNSRNVHGNQSSDVINNSMITNIINTLKNQTALENFGKYKGQSRQYDFSNIMIEHRDDAGNLINYGLFTQNPESKELTPTSYAHRLLQNTLFSGAGTVVNGKNVLYSEMSKGDYTTTAFINFFKTEDDYSQQEEADKIEFAEYFMRIPSDAPKNFIIKAPKYSVAGLFTSSKQTTTSIANINKFYTGDVTPDNNTIFVFGSNPEGRHGAGAAKVAREQFGAEYGVGEGLTGNSYALPTKDLRVKKNKGFRSIPRKTIIESIEKLYETARTMPEKQFKVAYRNTTTISLNGYTGLEMIDMFKEAGPIPSNIIFSKEWIDTGKFNTTTSIIKQNVSNSVNINHPIFQQFRHIFIQELQDMATAVNVLFENEGGKVRLDRDVNSPTYGMPIFKSGYANDSETARKLYNNYHTKKGKILKKLSTGKYALVGDVFTSDRFKVTILNKNGKYEVVNFADEILKSFNLLYGGANNTYLHTTTTSNGVQVELTDEQNAIINEQISKFIVAYSGRAVQQLEVYKNFIPEGMLTKLTAAEFALNHRLMYTNFNDLFEGDTKFYKDTQTFLKRAKEAQGSGVPYGIVDYSMDLAQEPTIVDSPLNDTTFNHISVDGVTSQVKINQYSKFRGVTIKNTVRTGDTIGTFVTDKDGNLVKDKNGNYKFKKPGVLADTLIDALVASGMSKPNAKIHAANMMAGYTNTTVNDAQSYITFEEWVRRITARGQLPQYKKLIDAVLDESKPLDAKTIGEFIQVQKNFYYDQYYNAELGVIAPRQIKNAEFVIVPRLVRGTQLEQVYNLMKEFNIDQLNTEETSKAGKCNVLTIWDNDGNITDKNIADFRANAIHATEYYNYNYLYTQQETPQHLAAENKAGIQIMKKIVDNIDKSNKTLYPLKEKFFKLYSQNIVDSYENLMKELNIKRDENGEISAFDQAILYDMLKDEVTRLGLDSNMMDYVTLDRDGVPMMPTYMSNVSTKLESIAQSMFNNRITRQKLPGWHAAQITNIGWTALSDTVEKRSYSKKLQYHPNGEAYVEIMLPKSNFKGLNYTKEDGTRKTDEELLKEIQDAKLDTMIGYRIPTEGKQSICVMKVVGFTDDALGSTIVVPDDWVSQTGSDFDIDSVYGIHFSAEVNKETGKLERIPYNEEDKRSERKTKGRNNELLQTMIDILSDPSSLEENLSRSNFDDIIHDRDEVINPELAKLRKARSPYDFFDQAAYQEDVMSGAKLKAFSVTRDTFCSICNTVQPTISSSKTVSVIYKKEDGYKESELKKHFDNIKPLKDKSGWIVTHDTLGWSKDNKNVVGKILTAYSSQTTAHILDAVKEGSIPNVNDFTFQVYKLFPDIGSDYKTAIAFMMQPGVSRIVNIYNANKSIYGEESGNVINKAIKEICKEICTLKGIYLPKQISVNKILEKLKNYSSDVAELFDCVEPDKYILDTKIENINKLNISASKLRDRINQSGEFDISSPVGKENQLLYDLGIILQYNKLNYLANDVSAYARVCNPDKFGAKQTIYATAKVFDNIQALVQDEYPSLLVDNKSFISAIYPNVDRGLDYYMQHTSIEDSAYSPLNAFLRYATAPSIKINRSLFATQSDEFRNEVEKLANLFSNGKSMNEKEYKSFQNYILNYIYSQAKAISSAVTYKNGRFVYSETNVDEERTRIYGYGKTPNLEVQDENGDIVEFEVADINHISDLEIQQFSTLSPAQKIYYIQEKFEDSGVFKYINVSLFNKGSNAGKQTIQYIENNEDIETVYNEFEKCFFNDNPLVALAAMDVIKYGFVVEGFKMKKNAVNKVIKNSVLLSNKTNIIADISTAVATIKDNAISTNQLRRNYIRSHSNSTFITGKKVYKEKDEQGNWHFELTPRADYMITISNESLAEKYGVVYDATPNDRNYHPMTVNSYVKLSINNRIILYRITDVNGTYVLYPVNTLEENENSDLSANPTNNKYLREEYYLGVINDFRDQLRERDRVVQEQIDAVINENGSITETQRNEIYENNVVDFGQVLESHKSERDKYKPKVIRRATGFAKSFNINDKNTVNTGGFEDVIAKVTARFSENPFSTLYLRSAALANYITTPGINGGSIQTINGRKYVIQKVNLSRLNRKYLGEENKDKVVKESNKDIQDIMQKAKDAGYTVHDVFMITPYEENVDVMHSSITEVNDTPDSTTLGVQAMAVMFSRRKSEGDIEAAKALKFLQDKQITGSAPSVQANVKDVIQTTAEYIDGMVNKLSTDMKYFIKDDNMQAFAINTPEAIAAIKSDPVVKERFLKTILDARALVRNFAIINEFDIQSEDETIRPFLNKIKEKISELQNATIIAETEKLFANEYLAKLSKNPRIQQNVLGVLDGYHSAAAFDAWVGDLQESSSPLIQIVSKEVMADIRSKEMMAIKRVQEFRKKLADIKKRAREAGVDIDWKKIIDENGKFIQNYNQAFLDKLAELKENISLAKSEHDVGSIEHLKAKLAYDKWKLANVNQPVIDEYYQRKIDIEEHMIKDYPLVYSAYKKLSDKRRELLSHITNGVLADNYRQELDEVKHQISNLTNDYVYDQNSGTFKEKYQSDDPNNPFKGEDRIIYSLNSTYALQKYLKDLNSLNSEFFDNSVKFGFQEELDRNLDIINNYEMRDANGNITTPMAELMKHDDYVKAKEWLAHNARYTATEEVMDIVNQAFKVFREGKQGRKLLSIIAKKQDAYDERGVIDGRKLTEKNIGQLYEEQLVNYGIREGQVFTDRTLISNSPIDDTIFKADFYKGMTILGDKNSEYVAKVKEINEILKAHYTTHDGTLHTSELSEDEIKTLKKLYEELENIKKYEKGSTTNAKSVHEFIKDNVDFVYDDAKFQQQEDLAKQRGERYYRMWLSLNTQIIEDENGNDIVVPNRYIYGYAVPRGYKADGTGDNTFVDKKKTDALHIIRNYTRNRKTMYYYEAYKEAQAKGKKEFRKWYAANHIYNPYTHTTEPLQCWTTLEFGEVGDDGKWNTNMEYEPAWNQTERTIKTGLDANGNPIIDGDDLLDLNKDCRNHDYKEFSSTEANYKGNNASYNSTVNRNSFENEIKEYLETILKENCHTTQSQQFLRNGYMPLRQKKEPLDAKRTVKEGVKFVGWINSATGREDWYTDSEIDYATDTTIDMPMTTLLKSKDTVKVDRKRPTREENETDESYQKRVTKWENDKAEAEAKNMEIHRSMLDDNWESVMEEFIQKAAHFNAIQDNKYMLFYAKNMLDRINVYVKNEGFNDLQKTGKRTIDGQDTYVTKKDTRLQEQYVNWIRRLVYDQWKKPNNGLTRAANILQSLTSAKFMMLNVTGGIANVTAGSTQILGEVFAKEYFGNKTWHMGLNTWRAGIPSFMADMYKDKASSLPSAIVKFMNVVDFDEINGVVTVPDMATYLKRARDLAFSPQAMGEHMMQNSALFAMMHSHRLVKRVDETTGKVKYEAVNEAEYMRDANEKALQNIMTDEQRKLYEAFKKKELSNANDIKEYAWFRKDLTTEFVNIYFNNEDKRKFIDKRKKYQAKAKEEFNNDETHPTIMSQLKLDDGILGFADDSIFAEIGDDAYQILGAFKGRVISVNKKIHGVYDKLGAAKLESYWWGGLVMQYHKHIYPGIMKRYRRQGYFNEERGTIEKGCYASIKDFLALPLHKRSFAKKLQEDNNMTDANLQAVKGVQNIVKNYVEFAVHAKTYYQMMNEYDRANIRRAFGDFCGVVSALCLAIALHAAGDDDKDHNLVYNLMMYEADRLASESFMYNPVGVYAEGKKLWSSPIAAQTAISDLLATTGLISQYMIQGDEFDPYYSTGLYKGENKFWVQIRRNIPIYHSINMVERLERSNKYYKLGDNMLSIVPVKDIADFISK